MQTSLLSCMYDDAQVRNFSRNHLRTPRYPESPIRMFFVPCVITSMRSVLRGVRASVVKNALESGSAGENTVPRDNGTTDYSLES